MYVKTSLCSEGQVIIASVVKNPLLYNLHAMLLKEYTLPPQLVRITTDALDALDTYPLQVYVNSMEMNLYIKSSGILSEVPSYGVIICCEHEGEKVPLAFGLFNDRLLWNDTITLCCYAENQHGYIHVFMYIDGFVTHGFLMHQVQELRSRINLLETQTHDITYLVDRGQGRAPMLQIGIGRSLLVRCSSRLRDLFPNLDSHFVPGMEFTVTQESVNRGSAPYIPLNDDGRYVEPYPYEGGKALLCPGTYRIIVGGAFDSNDSVVTAVRVK